jgi:hypothetical protein
MNKYKRLWEYHQNDGNITLKLSFEKINTIIGFDLDHYFFAYKKEVI